MNISPKATKAELLKIIQDLRDEATGWHQHAKKLEDKLAAANTTVDSVADRKPWALIAIVAALAFVVGVVVGWWL